MSKHRNAKEKSSEMESNSSEEENVDELVDSNIRCAQKIKTLNKKLSVEELKRKPLYPSLTDLNAVDSSGSFHESHIETYTKVSKSESSHLLNEARQRGAAASPKQSSSVKFNSNYTPECNKRFQNNEDSPASNGVWKLLGFFIFLFVVLIYIIMWGSPSTKHFDVASIMTALRSDFADQPEITFRIIKAALSRVSVEDPTAPAILILISSVEARHIRDAFSLHLAKSISQSSDFVSIENNALKMPGEMKIEIDNNIKNNLTQNSIKAVLVKNLDLIPFEAAMMFHSYCDHENAPFKKAIYVMTVTSDEIIKPKSDPKEWDALATKRLNNLWQNGNENQVSSLISRLSVSVCAIVARTR